MLARLRLLSLFLLLACVIIVGANASAHVQGSQSKDFTHFPAAGLAEGAGASRAPTSSTAFNETVTSITLLPATPSGPLSASNSFAVSYILNGSASTADVQGSTLALTTDIGSSVTISSVSTGSTSTERWVLDAQGGAVSISSGSAATFYYYDLLMQSASYATSDGSALPNPILDYTTAPATASSQSSQILAGLVLQSSTQPLWVIRGSQVSTNDQIPGASGERWSLQTSQWTISGADQIPSLFLYYHQFYVTLGYVVKGGGSGSGVPTISCIQYGAQIGIPVSSSNWVDSGSSCSYSLTLSGSTQNQRWAVPSSTVVVSQPGAVSLAYAHQYPLGITYSISGGSPNPPTVTGVSFGTSATLPLQSSPATEWFDAGSSYSISNPLSPSGPSERWVTAGTTSGVMQGQTVVSDVFYHQFLTTASFSVRGGGGAQATGPTLSYMSFGSPASIQLTGSKQTFWADGGSQYSVPPTLSDSSGTERWYVQAAQGIVQAPSAFAFGYDHQFLLSVSGGGVSSQWYNSSSTAQLSVPGVFARTSGSGQKMTSYSIDGGSLKSVKPTTGTISISIPMNSAHQLTIDSVQQYQVSLDTSAAGALSSITSPTLTGDGYWYDQGTHVSLVLTGVWNRSAGTDERLLSYSLNGVSKDISTTGPVDVLMTVPLSSPETVTAVATAQYRLVTVTGSVAAITGASISGDAGWYDGGSSVTVSYYYSWNNASGIRHNAVGYSFGGSGNVTQIARSGSGTFPVNLVMSRPETITITSVTQYSLTLSGGHSVSLSPASATHDSFYDSGVKLTAMTDYTWDTVNNNVRQNLVSFTLDSFDTNVTRASSGSFTTPAIVFNGPHVLAFNGVTQDLVVLQFKDGSGTSTIVPNSVQIQLGSPPVVSVPSSGVWLDNGTRFQIYQVMWEGADVKLAGHTVYNVNAPVNQTITDRVYSGNMIVTDYLGLPISGARVSVVLANGTTITSTTDSEGSLALREIPIGNYTASVSYLGAITTIKGNAALADAAHARVLASYPTLALIALVASIIVIMAVVVVAPGRRLRRAIPPDSPAQHLTQLCKHCNATIAVGSLRCPECGMEQV